MAFLVLDFKVGFFFLKFTTYINKNDSTSMLKVDLVKAYGHRYCLCQCCLKECISAPDVETLIKLHKCPRKGNHVGTYLKTVMQLFGQSKNILLFPGKSEWPTSRFEACFQQLVRTANID